MGDDSFSLSGNTRPADLDTQLQLLAAYLTKPGWRSELYQQGLTSMQDALAKLDTNPMSLFGAKWPGFLHSGDARWSYPSLEEVRAAKLEDVKALIGPALSNGPIEVTIVGGPDGPLTGTVKTTAKGEAQKLKVDVAFSAPFAKPSPKK